MKTLLLNPPLFDAGKLGKYLLEPPAPPLGIAYIASTLDEAGFAVNCRDLSFLDWQKTEEFIRQEAPGIVGISTLTEGRASAFRLAKLIKSINQETKVIMGGHHVTHTAEQTLLNLPIDAVVIGEGEISMRELVKAWEEKTPLEKVEGIAFMKNGDVYKTPSRKALEDLDSLPFPSYRFFDFNDYPKRDRVPPHIKKLRIDGKRLNELRYASIVTSRGCPFACNFCSTALWGGRWRARSPENVLNEMEMLYKNYGVRFFTIADDVLTVDKQRIIELCNGIVERGLEIAWDCETRVDLCSDEMFKAMKRAGCTTVAFGLESGSDKVLAAINKKANTQQTIEIFESAHKNGLYPHALLMVGNPGESDETVKDTAQLLKIIKPASRAVSITMVYPGTELLNTAMKHELLTDDYWLTELPPPYYTVEHNLEQLQEWFEQIKEYTLQEYCMWYFRKIRNFFSKITGLHVTRDGVTRRKEKI